MRRRSPSLLRIAIFAVAARPLARLRFGRLATILERVPRRAAGAAEAERLGERVERALALTSRVTTHTCLTRGLTRYYFLRRAGVEVRLVFGMQANGDGHCWILRDGEPYREAVDPRAIFTETFSIPARDAD